MVQFTSLFSLTSLAAAAAASPQWGHGHGSPPSNQWPPAPPHSYGPKCVVKSTYPADDSDAIADAFVKCAKGGTISFEMGAEYNVFKPITALNLSDVTIEMYGNLNLPQNITYIQALYNDTTYASGSDNLYWFALGGSNLLYKGTPNVTAGWINSYGQLWWDANIYPATGQNGRPHLLLFNVTGGTMQHFKSRKPIAWGVQLQGSDIYITDTVVDAYSVTGSFPFNTDGFDVSATNVEITKSVIYNGDDACAVGSGSSGIRFHNNVIGYQTHGMSIGSLGENQAQYATVSDVHFYDNTVINGVYGARFKSWEGGQGLAKNISWTNIRVYNVTFPIFVTQTYYNQGNTQTQNGNGATTGRPNNATVNMEDFTWANWTGTINQFKPGDGSCASDPCWYNVGLPNLTHTESIIIECNTDKSCKNFELSNIEVYPQSMAMPRVICMNATAELNPKLGFTCANSSYVPQGPYSL